MATDNVTLQEYRKDGKVIHSETTVSKWTSKVIRTKTEIFNFIEMFYNPKKRHSHTGGVSPANFEKAYFLEQQTV